MDFLYSLYDALVSINVPNDKARAVVDAMERDMATNLATKTDLDSLRLATKADVELLRLEMNASFALQQKDLDSGLAAVRKDMEAGLTAVRKDMEAGFAAGRKDLDTAIAAVRKDMEAGFSAMDARFTLQNSQIVIRLSAVIVVVAGLALSLFKLS